MNNKMIVTRETAGLKKESTMLTKEKDMACQILITGKKDNIHHVVVKLWDYTAIRWILNRALIYILLSLGSVLGVIPEMTNPMIENIIKIISFVNSCVSIFKDLRKMVLIFKSKIEKHTDKTNKKEHN